MRYSKTVIPVQEKVRSLCWHGDTLMDWAGGGIQYQLDGTFVPRKFIMPHSFDKAIISPSGKYTVLCQQLGTKGVIFKDDKIIREINRSFYYAGSYEYPVAVFRLADGREILAHCPNSYRQLEFAALDTGEQLTQRDSEAEDFFHSRLQVSDDGRFLLSAGWVWHPFDYIALYDIPQALEKPQLLDQSLRLFWDTLVIGNCDHNASFIDDENLVITSEGHEYVDEDEDSENDKEQRFTEIRQYNIAENSFSTYAKLVETPIGTMFAFGDCIVSFYQHPKVIEIVSGKIILSWPDLALTEQDSCIFHEVGPPLAIDRRNRRFAVAVEGAIVVIQLELDNSA